MYAFCFSIQWEDAAFTPIHHGKILQCNTTTIFFVFVKLGYIGGLHEIQRRKFEIEKGDYPFSKTMQPVP